MGRSSEILRDELKFTKFVGRLRKRFSGIFTDMLKTQLILKNVVTPEDWDHLEEHIQYDYLYDNHFSDLKESELLQEKLGVIAAMEPYMGRYFSAAYVRNKVLKQTEDEIKEIDSQIDKEIEEGILPDPAAMMDPETGMPVDGQSMMGAPINGEEVNGSATEVKMPKGGEI